METKICSKCKEEKNPIEFYANSKTKDKRELSCKECRNKEKNKESLKVTQKEWRENNKEYIKEYNRNIDKEKKDEYRQNYNIKNKDKIEIYKKSDKRKNSQNKWREDNKDKINNYQNKWREDNKDKSKEYNDNNKDYRKKYYENNKEKIVKYGKERREKENYYTNYNNRIRERMREDIVFRLKTSIRRSIWNSLNSMNYTKKSKTFVILGISYNEFKLYIESKFEEWMSWENYGKYDGSLNYGWDLDHITPISSAKTEEDVIRLNNYTNFQPLCSKVNRDIKKDKLTW